MVVTAGLVQKKNWTVTEPLSTPSTLPARLFHSVILASSSTTQKRLAIRTTKNTALRSERATERSQSNARINSTRKKTTMATAKETFASATKILRIILLRDHKFAKNNKILVSLKIWEYLKYNFYSFFSNFDPQKLQTLRLSIPKTGNSLKMASTTTNAKSLFNPLLVSFLDRMFPVSDFIFNRF